MENAASLDDLTYYARRAREEHDRSLLATDDDSAIMHKTLAERYDWLIRHQQRHVATTA